MPLQFTVPQFIDVEDKILGPVSVRQFGIIMIGAIFTVASYFIFTFLVFIPVAIIILGIAALFAFYRINGQYFHFFILNLIRTFRRPSMKIWNRRIDDEEVIREARHQRENLPPPAATKYAPSNSRLRELSLIVDTGGAYGEESWEVVRDKEIV